MENFSSEMLEHAAKALDLDSQFFLYPVRHHSAASSYHLVKVIEAYRPDAIALECPNVFNETIKDVCEEGVVPPIALYTYGNIKNKETDEMESARYLFPLMQYSPEYVAVKEAKLRGIYLECIDLDSFTKEAMREFDNHDYYDDDVVEQRSDFYATLTKNSDTLSFAEFWDKHFETNGFALSTMDYLKNIYGFCYGCRKSLNEDNEFMMVQRELQMLKSITALKKNYKKILVVTGGSHTIALCDYLYFKKKKEKPFKFNKIKSSTYLIPYSFIANDELSYAAGISFPFYHDMLYKNILESCNPIGSSVLAPVYEEKRELSKAFEKVERSKSFAAIKMCLSSGNEMPDRVSSSLLDQIEVEDSSKKSKSKLSQIKEAEKNAAPEGKEEKPEKIVKSFLNLERFVNLLVLNCGITVDKHVNAYFILDRVARRNKIELFYNDFAEDPLFKDRVTANIKKHEERLAVANARNSSDDDSAASVDGETKSANEAAALEGSAAKVSAAEGSDAQGSASPEQIGEESAAEASPPKKATRKRASKAKAAPKAEVVALSKEELEKIQEEIKTQALVDRKTALDKVDPWLHLEYAVARAFFSENPTKDNEIKAVNDLELIVKELYREDYSKSEQKYLLETAVAKEELADAFFNTNFYFINHLRDFKKQKMGTANKIACEAMCRGLANLRGKIHPSSYDLVDAVRSTFIKEEIKGKHYLLVALNKEMMSYRRGIVPLNVKTPAIMTDFLKYAKLYRLDLDGTKVVESRIDINKGEKYLERSQFFYRMSFVCPSFIVSEPNFQDYDAYTLRRVELFKYRNSDQAVMDLITAGEIGETIYDACKKQLYDELQTPQITINRVSQLYVKAVNMGMVGMDDMLLKLIKEAAAYERDISNVSCALERLNDFAVIAKSSEASQEEVRNVNRVLVERAAVILQTFDSVNDELLTELIKAVSDIAYFANKDEVSKNYFYDVIQDRLNEDISLPLQGLFISILYKHRRTTYHEFISYVNKLVLGAVSSNTDMAGFFYAVINVSRETLFYKNGILSLLNNFLMGLDGYDFIKLLVLLKRSFVDFSDTEIYKITKLLLKLLGQEVTVQEIEVDPEEHFSNVKADALIRDSLGSWFNLDLEKIASSKDVDVESEPEYDFIDPDEVYAE